MGEQLMEIKNWKEDPRVQEIKQKFENEKIRNAMHWVFQIVVTLVFAAVVAIRRFQTVTMQESSMEPTISVGDRFFINKAVYKFSSPQRGDMIVFRTSASDDAALHIRRVIGLPGEKIQISGGRILINGEVYKEGRDFPMMTNPGLAATTITLESGQYFVLGDNRNNSEDSRYADIGTVSRRYILGKIWFTCSPFEKLGFTKG